MAENGKATGDHVTELKDLIVSYAKQETIDPLKNLGRYVGYGMAGGTCIALGAFLVCMALLRGLQGIEAEEQATGPATDGWFTGTWSFAPYLIVALVGLAVVGAAVWAITRTTTPERVRLSDAPRAK